MDFPPPTALELANILAEVAGAGFALSWVWDFVVMRWRGTSSRHPTRVGERFSWLNPLAIFLPKELRERMLTPAVEDLRIDFAIERRRSAGRAWRAWVAIVFSIRALACFLNTVRAGVIGYLLKAAPGPLRRWWTS